MEGPVSSYQNYICILQKLVIKYIKMKFSIKIKNILFFLSLFFFSCSFNKKEKIETEIEDKVELLSEKIPKKKFFTLGDLDIKDKIFFLKNSDKKATGVINKKWKNGNEKIYQEIKNGELNGISVEWYENGKKKFQGNFEKNQSMGIIKNFYKNGNLKIKAVFLNGKKNGEVKENFENGKKKYSKNYRNGIKYGEFIEWYENGEIRIKENFENNKHHGKFEQWFKDGSKMSEGNYKNGLADGKFIDFYKKDKIKEKAIFENGREIERSCFNLDEKEIPCSYF